MAWLGPSVVATCSMLGRSNIVVRISACKRAAVCCSSCEVTLVCMLASGCPPCIAAAPGLARRRRRAVVYLDIHRSPSLFGIISKGALSASTPLSVAMDARACSSGCAFDLRPCRALTGKLTCSRNWSPASKSKGFLLARELHLKAHTHTSDGKVSMTLREAWSKHLLARHIQLSTQNAASP